MTRQAAKDTVAPILERLRRHNPVIGYQPSIGHRVGPVFTTMAKAREWQRKQWFSMLDVEKLDVNSLPMICDGYYTHVQFGGFSRE